MIQMLILAAAVAAAAPSRPAPLPTEPAPRAAICAATLMATAQSVRTSSADTANELDALARRFHARASALFQEAGKPAEANRLIAQSIESLMASPGLPSGTFDKAVTCQNEGAALPAG